MLYTLPVPRYFYRWLIVAALVLPLPLLAAEAKKCTPFIDTRIRLVNMEKVRDAWLGWQNAERKTLGLKPLVINPHLNRTALLWSQNAATQKSITHKRTAAAGYYDYSAIETWFAEKGLEFENDNRITYSENIGYGPYSCKKGDCTSKLTEAVRKTFDFYMQEKDKKDRPHYNSIIRPEFTQVGIGIALKDNTYYLTVHYATSINNDPLPLCRTRLRLGS